MPLFNISLEKSYERNFDSFQQRATSGLVASSIRHPVRNAEEAERTAISRALAGVGGGVITMESRRERVWH